MSKVELQGENGKFNEDDLWKLFSDHPDRPSETIRFFCELELALKRMRLEDETRYYRVYEHSSVPAPPEGARYSATVTQRNLRRVAAAIAGRGGHDAAIQYLGSGKPTDE
jgi:hypothetical protein